MAIKIYPNRDIFQFEHTRFNTDVLLQGMQRLSMLSPRLGNALDTELGSQPLARSVASSVPLA